MLVTVGALVLGLLRRVGDALDRVQVTLSAPDLGAPVGSTIPSFTLSTIDGRRIHGDTISGPRHTLFLFLGAGCAACGPVVATLGDDSDRIDDVPLVVVLREPHEVEELRLPASARALFDQDGSAGVAFGNRATPQGYLVGNGRVLDRRLIASRGDLVAMAEAVRERKEVDAPARESFTGAQEQREMRRDNGALAQTDGAQRG
jgi:hypothetical protein